MSHPINFTDPFADSLVSVTSRVENVSHVLIEAFVTQRPASRRYACRLSALASNAYTALCFLQVIDAAHRLGLVGERVKEEVRAERASSRRAQDEEAGVWIRSGLPREMPSQSRMP